MWFGDFAFQSATTFFSAEFPVSCVDNLFSHGRLLVEDVFVLITAPLRRGRIPSIPARGSSAQSMILSCFDTFVVCAFS